ncbi:MAG: hypothetical protein II282_02585, partial [Alistipes sp.]|nr:hypothetical protein [Alistipes sp.]
GSYRRTNVNARVAKTAYRCGTTGTCKSTRQAGNEQEITTVHASADKRSKNKTYHTCHGRLTVNK